MVQTGRIELREICLHIWVKRTPRTEDTKCNPYYILSTLFGKLYLKFVITLNEQMYKKVKISSFISQQKVGDWGQRQLKLSLFLVSRKKAEYKLDSTFFNKVSYIFHFFMDIFTTFYPFSVSQDSRMLSDSPPLALVNKL